MLDLLIKSSDGVKHVLSVCLISFLLINFVKIKLVNFKGEDLGECVVIDISCNISLYGVLPCYFSDCVVDILADYFWEIVEVLDILRAFSLRLLHLCVNFLELCIVLLLKFNDSVFYTDFGSFLSYYLIESENVVAIVFKEFFECHVFFVKIFYTHKDFLFQSL